MDLMKRNRKTVAYPIGKFGFGLPNASISQTRRVELYTRTSKNEPITKPG